MLFLFSSCFFCLVMICSILQSSWKCLSVSVRFFLLVHYLLLSCLLMLLNPNKQKHCYSTHGLLTEQNRGNILLALIVYGKMQTHSNHSNVLQSVDLFVTSEMKLMAIILRIRIGYLISYCYVTLSIWQTLLLPLYGFLMLLL